MHREAALRFWFGTPCQSATQCVYRAEVCTSPLALPTCNAPCNIERVHVNNSVEGEVLTMRLEPGTPGPQEESLATRLFTPEEGKSMEPYT